MWAPIKREVTLRITGAGASTSSPRVVLELVDGQRMEHDLSDEQLGTLSEHAYNTDLTKLASAPDSPEAQEAAERVGDVLSALAFTREMAARLADDVSGSTREHPLRIRVATHPAVMTSQPWELLRIAIQDGRGWLARQPFVSVVRSSSDRNPEKGASLPPPGASIRLAVVDATHVGGTKADLEVGLDGLTEELEALKRTDMRPVTVQRFGADWAELRDRFGAETAVGSFGALVYVGHATASQRSMDGYLHMLTTGGGSRPEPLELAGAEFAQLARAAGAQLAVLAACESARAGFSRETQPSIMSWLTDTHPTQRLPAALGVQHRITDVAATTFLRSFLSPLASGAGIEQALSDMRNDLANEFPETIFWAGPVLRLNAPGGVLWPLVRIEPAHLAARTPLPILSQGDEYFLLIRDENDRTTAFEWLPGQPYLQASGESVVVSADARVCAHLVGGHLRLSWISRQAVTPVGFHLDPVPTPVGARVVAVWLRNQSTVESLVTTSEQAWLYRCRDGHEPIVQSWAEPIGCAVHLGSTLLWTTPDGTPIQALLRRMGLSRISSLDAASSARTSLIVAAGYTADEQPGVRYALNDSRPMPLPGYGIEPVTVIRPLRGEQPALAVIRGKIQRFESHSPSTPATVASGRRRN